MAGIAAAAAAARQGARTVLIEKTDRLGGTPFVMFHDVICGLYGSHPAVPHRPLNGGLTHELCDALARKNPELRPRRMGAVYVLPFHPVSLRQALLDLLPSTPRLTLHLNSEVVSADFSQPASPQGTLRSTLDGRHHVITTKVLIDCTGDGAVIATCGAAMPSTPPADRPYAGFSIGFSAIDAETPELLAINVPYALRQAVVDHAAPPWLQFTTFQPGPGKHEGICKLSLPPALPPDREADVVQESVAAVDRILRTTCPAFKQAVIKTQSPYPVQREGRRLQGRMILTSEDVLAARRFPNPAALNAWPIERWTQNQRPELRYSPPGEAGAIPIACLQSERYPELWAAGRCLSATSGALASCRVIGVCLPLGEAAGIAAARQAQHAEG